MNDLLTKSFMSYVDLKKASMKDPDLDLESGREPDLQMQPIQQPDHNLTAFLNEAELVKQEMNSIRETLTQLELANQDSKSLHNPESLKSNRRTAVANGLRKKLKELMMDFQELRQRMMSEYKETVGRRYFTVTGEEANEEVIEKIINSGSDGQGGEEFMSRAIQEHGRGKVLETVVEIQDRHDAAKEIETSLLELHQVFLDMAVMVEAQGEKMDDIEHHVMNAAHYVNDGTKNLKTAKGYQKQSRKCMCFGIILLLIIILVIVIPILTSVTKS
ncbi:putative target SNARE coiled-coil domain, syntaxin domain, syntaxin/epimorphin [Helianthus debilis subsp. tardiflorus]